ncbi:hypothetical protein BJ741DRAFT_584513 [Chytriomyces cf. hyalinus JEL632]|nr:hypothetical protein BJ741DRAFT_584513 [Chytriomyces cf. hyalinus JEL632]
MQGLEFRGINRALSMQNEWSTTYIEMNPAGDSPRQMFQDFDRSDVIGYDSEPHLTVGHFGRKVTLEIRFRRLSDSSVCKDGSGLEEWGVHLLSFLALQVGLLVAVIQLEGPVRLLPWLIWWLLTDLNHPTRAVIETSDSMDRLSAVSAIDSLSPQGMFKLSIDAEHAMQEVEVWNDLCALYDKPRLYFVVPPRLFESFAKQKFLETDEKSGENLIEKMEQFVLELPVE